MAVAPFRFHSGAGYVSANPASPTTLFTVAGGHTRTLGKLLIVNTDETVEHWISLYHVLSGGSYGSGLDDYIVVKKRDVRASAGMFGTLDIRDFVGDIFTAGDVLVALAESANKLKALGAGTDNG